MLFQPKDLDVASMSYPQSRSRRLGGITSHERLQERRRTSGHTPGQHGMAGRSKSGSASSPAASAAVNQMGFSADSLAAGQLALTPSS